MGATPQIRGWVGSGGMLGRRTSYFTHSAKFIPRDLVEARADRCEASVFIIGAADGRPQDATVMDKYAPAGSLVGYRRRSPGSHGRSCPLPVFPPGIRLMPATAPATSPALTPPHTADLSPLCELNRAIAEDGPTFEEPGPASGADRSLGLKALRKC